MCFTAICTYLGRYGICPFCDNNCKLSQGWQQCSQLQGGLLLLLLGLWGSWTLQLHALGNMASALIVLIVIAFEGDSCSYGAEGLLYRLY